MGSYSRGMLDFGPSIIHLTAKSVGMAYKDRVNGSPIDLLPLNDNIRLIVR
jgi:hypothetical protein